MDAPPHGNEEKAENQAVQKVGAEETEAGDAGGHNPLQDPLEHHDRAEHPQEEAVTDPERPASPRVIGRAAEDPAVKKPAQSRQSGTPKWQRSMIGTTSNSRIAPATASRNDQSYRPGPRNIRWRGGPYRRYFSPNSRTSSRSFRQ